MLGFFFKKKKLNFVEIFFKVIGSCKKNWNFCVFCIVVIERICENEVVKMIRLKEGFVRIVEVYVELGKKCFIVF